MKVAFWGNFGTHNLGNECTLHAMLAGARRHAPDAELLGVCNGPQDTRARHAIDAVSIAPEVDDRGRGLPRKLRRAARELADWGRAIRVMRDVDRLIMTGTGMLADTHEGGWGMPYQMFKWSAAARLWGHKVAFVSVGAEDIAVPVGIRFFGWALRLAAYRSYRDPVSRGRATRLAARAAEDPIFPDLAFSLPEEITLRRVREANPGDCRVAVGIYGVESGAEGMRDYVECIGSFIRWLLEQGCAVRIVIGDADYDQDARRSLRSWLAARNVLDRVVDEPATSFEMLLTQLADVDLVVATRFHNVLLSMLLEKPVLSVSHMDKNDQLMEAMGLSGYCMPLAGVTVDRLIQKYRDMERNSQHLRRQIHEKNACFRQALEVQYATVFGRLEAAA